MSDDNGQPKQLPPGLCEACNQDVDRARLVSQVSAPGEKFHRDHVGQFCGPVRTRFAYRVVVWIEPPGAAGRMQRFYITRNRPIQTEAEENGVAEFIARSWKAQGPNGAVIVGAHPYVGFLSGELVGSQ